MTITKCDDCKKEIKDNKKTIKIFLYPFEVLVLCEQCGVPFNKLLIKRKLVKGASKE